MADWVWVESPGTGRTTEPRVRVAQFGDGYMQRAPDGLNPNADDWDYQAADVDDAVAQEMDDFLRANATAGFNYVPLWQTTAIRVWCPNWRRTQGSRPGFSDFSAKFLQIFEP